MIGVGKLVAEDICGTGAALIGSAARISRRETASDIGQFVHVELDLRVRWPTSNSAHTCMSGRRT